MTRTNLVKNPSFKLGLSYWRPINGARTALGTNSPLYGETYMEVSKAEITGSGVETTEYFAVVPSLEYATSAYVRTPNLVSATEQVNIVIRVTWLDFAGEALSESTTSPVLISEVDGWKRISGVSRAPVGASQAKIAVVQLMSTTSGTVFQIDGVLVEQSSYVGGFIDNITVAEKTAAVNRSLTPYQSNALKGMQLNADVVINDLVLNTIDESDVVWVCTDISGWWGPTGPEIPDIPRGVEDGSYEVSGRYTSRTLVLKGVFLPPSPDLIGASRDKLISAINLVRKGAWLRTNEDPTKAAFVKLSGTPEINTVNARGRTEFSIGLRASDPVKYHWDDRNPDGLSVVTIPGTQKTGTVTNIGTNDVTAVFELTGPLEAGSTVTNTKTGEVITLVEPLRGDSNVGTVLSRELYDNVVTLTTSRPHGLVVGDEIIVFGVGTPFDATNETFTVISSTSEAPYRVSYERRVQDIAFATTTGSVSLARRDVLEIDTYEKSVSLNGNSIGQRWKIETLVDWLKLYPGDNTIVFSDNIRTLKVIKKTLKDGLVTLVTTGTNYLIPGEQVQVDLASKVPILKKKLTSNVVTLTTETDHGISLNDEISVVTQESSEIVAKEAQNGVVTLTTKELGDFSLADNITVALPEEASIATKTSEGGTVTLKTLQPHGFSTGDSVQIKLKTTSAISAKKLFNNVATLETPYAHGFSTGDNITVTLSTISEVGYKSISLIPGSPVVLTTTRPHGFSVGDSVRVALPETTRPVARSYSGDLDYKITIITANRHGFSVGDRIQMDLGLKAQLSINSVYAITPERTTILVSGNKYEVGEQIVVSGVGPRFDGVHTITAKEGDRVEYYKEGEQVFQTALIGSVYNKTIGDGYQGVKVLDEVTANTFSYYYYAGGPMATGSSYASPTAKLVNLTNVSVNGVRKITGATSTQITYF